ncbi:MAG TPA: hypothetical protein VKE93_10455, partial [Candidatus Angelobacter sp.]|nr:hypothetical protein [Candidatus Angelobacter sp.]
SAMKQAITWTIEKILFVKLMDNLDSRQCSTFLRKNRNQQPFRKDSRKCSVWRVRLTSLSRWNRRFLNVVSFHGGARDI